MKQQLNKKESYFNTALVSSTRVVCFSLVYLIKVSFCSGDDGLQILLKTA